MARFYTNPDGKQFRDVGLGFVPWGIIADSLNNGGLGQAKRALYSIPGNPVANNFQWVRSVQPEIVKDPKAPSTLKFTPDQYNYAIYKLAVGKVSGPPTNLDYDTIRNLFGPYTVELVDERGEEVWYIGSNGNHPSSRQNFEGSTKITDGWYNIQPTLFKAGLDIATPNGVQHVPPYLYSRDGMTGVQLAALGATAMQQRQAGQLETCPVVGEITPIQAEALIALGSRDACVERAKNLQPPTGAGRFQYSINAAVAALKSKEMVEGPSTKATPATCVKAGYVAWSDPINPPLCKTGYKLDRDAANCVMCVPSCPEGFQPPDLLTQEQCPGGEVIYTHPTTGCVKCVPARNCWLPGQAQVPCPAPLLVAPRGRYLCCVQSPTPGYDPTAQPGYSTTGTSVTGQQAPVTQDVVQQAQASGQPQTQVKTDDTSKAGIMSTLTTGKTPIVLGAIALGLALLFGASKRAGKSTPSKEDL